MLRGMPRRAARTPADALALPVLRTGRRRGHGGRRAEYSAATKRSLVAAATRQFTVQGYSSTSLDSIVAEAKVTKGALYHHFSGKQAVFEAVFERIEQVAAKRVRRAATQADDPWEQALAGLRTFLDVVQDPAYQRIVIREGPAVLGHERFREQVERSSYATVSDIVRAVLHEHAPEVDTAMVDTFSTIFFGAMSAAGESVSSAEDPKAAGVRVETAIGFILDGMRTLAESGAVPDPEERLRAGPDDVDG